MTTAEATKIPCPECSEEFDNTKAGRARRATHIRTVHPEATARGKAEAESQDYLTDLAPMARRFHDALERALPKNAGKIRPLTDTFTRNLESLGQDRHKFRSWITRHGLTQDQIAMVEEELFGVEGLATGNPMGGVQVVGYVPQPGGGYQPMVFVVPTQPGGTTAAPWGWGGLPSLCSKLRRRAQAPLYAAGW